MTGRLCELDPAALRREIDLAPSLTAVGIKWGVSRERVRQLCARHGVKHGKTRGHPAWNRKNILRDPAERWLWSLLTNAEIAQMEGTSLTAARRNGRILGIRPRPSVPLAQRWKIHCVASLWTSGISERGIAEMMSLTPGAVHQYIYRARVRGIPAPYREGYTSSGRVRTR